MATCVQIFGRYPVGPSTTSLHPAEAWGLALSVMDLMQKLCAEAGRHVQDDGGFTGASFFEQGYVRQLQEAVKDALKAGVNPMSLHRLVADTAFKHLEEEPNLC